MIIQHNLSAINTAYQNKNNESDMAKATERLSSGYRINRAADDAASLAISEKMRRQIRGLTQASANAQDGISLVQIADGALNETQDILQRMNELSVKAANGTLTQSDREYIQSEMNALVDEVDRIANSTTFNEEIYPLKGKISIPFIGTQTMTINVSGPGTVTCDGIDYHDGDSFNVDVFATFSSPGALKDAGIFFHSSGGGSGHCTVTTMPLDTSLSDINITYTRPDEYTIDEAGHILVKNPDGTNNTQYIGANLQWLYPVSLGIAPDAKTVDITPSDPVFIQAGSENDEAQRIDISFVDATSMGLKLRPVDVTSEQSSISYVDKVKNALGTVSEYRSDFGATQNRLESTIRNLDNVVENTTAAESQIRDTDMAAQMVQFSNLNILQNATSAMLAQANQSQELALSLLS